ncbi:hypothetical protein CVS40_5115 [Lucilia cuprina]|nr:hypothetical protein CVS40_5115 [Lucilia cuprina]
MPEATKDVLIEKLNIFRSSYRRENKKVKESMRSGSSQVNIYKPKWIYYEKIKFLDEKEDDNTPLSSLDDDFRRSVDIGHSSLEPSRLQ